MNEETLRAILDEYQKKTENLIGFLTVKVDSLDNKVDSLDQKVNFLDHKVDSLDYKVDKNFETLDLKIRDLGVLVEKNSDEIRILAEQVADIPLLREEVRGNSDRLDKVEGKLDVALDYLKSNLEARVAKLEEVVF